jgi:hypothetical protein
LEAVAGLQPALERTAALDPVLAKVADLDARLGAVAALDAPLKEVAKLEAPLVALGAMANLTQPATYVPMFGYIGLVLFLAIWGGVKLGRR